MSIEPVLHLRRAMGTVVVHHQVQRPLAGELAVDAAQEPQKLLVAVTRVAVANDFAGEHVERREQGRRSVSLVIVSHGAAAPLLQWQSGLGALQSLNLALFVYTKHNRLVGRIQIKTNHVREFLEKSRIA